MAGRIWGGKRILTEEDLLQYPNPIAPPDWNEARRKLAVFAQAYRDGGQEALKKKFDELNPEQPKN